MKNKDKEPMPKGVPDQSIDDRIVRQKGKPADIDKLRKQLDDIYKQNTKKNK